MPPGRKRFWMLVQALLAVAVVAAVGWNLAGQLGNPQLGQLTAFRWPYLLLAGLLYLGCHTLWGAFWVQLLRGQGVKIPWLVGVRAYFVSQFGKYIPGKAWVIFLRIGLLKSIDVKPTVVIVTGTYETLVNMAAGAVLGGILLPWSGLAESLGEVQRYGLLGLALVPVALFALNWLIRRIAKKYQAPGSPPFPVPSFGLIVRGFVQAFFGWGLLGLSLYFVACGLSANPPEFTFNGFLQNICGVCISYVIGFAVLFLPGGLGAREAILQLVLVRQLGETDGSVSLAAALAVALRVVWTLFEVIAALSLGCWYPKAKPTEVPA